MKGINPDLPTRALEGISTGEVIDSEVAQILHDEIEAREVTEKHVKVTAEDLVSKIGVFTAAALFVKR